MNTGPYRVRMTAEHLPDGKVHVRLWREDHGVAGDVEERIVSRKVWEKMKKTAAKAKGQVKP